MAGSETAIRLFGTADDSIVDGPGLRFSVFVQGCSHHCPGCHNPESQPREGGTLATVGGVLDEVRANKLIEGVTLSGGEPFEQATACAELARALKAEGYSVWAYTGYLYEDLLNVASRCSADEEAPDPAGLSHSGSNGSAAAPLLDPAGVRDLLANVDVLVDGPFVQDLKSYTLTFKGSSNQRIIDLAATRAAGRVIEWEPEKMAYRKPESW